MRWEGNRYRGVFVGGGEAKKLTGVGKIYVTFVLKTEVKIRFLQKQLQWIEWGKYMC